jgi:hypothetical protein
MVLSRPSTFSTNAPLTMKVSAAEGVASATPKRAATRQVDERAGMGTLLTHRTAPASASLPRRGFTVGKKASGNCSEWSTGATAKPFVSGTFSGSHETVRHCKKKVIDVASWPPRQREILPNPYFRESGDINDLQSKKFGFRVVRDRFQR